MKALLIILLLLSQGFAVDDDGCRAYYEIFETLGVGAAAGAAGAAGTKAGLLAYGLSSVGPVAGSAAAASQGAGVAAGSWFALGQSMAMTGLAGLMMPAVIVGGLGAIIYGAYSIDDCYAKYQKRQEKERQSKM